MSIKRMTSLLTFAALAAACGGNTLDLGGVPDANSKSDAKVDLPSYPVPAQVNARSLHSEGSRLYWMVDETGVTVVNRCEKSDCRSSVTPIARINGSGMAGFFVRGDTMYLIGSSAIYACSVDDCAAPQRLVYNVAPQAVAFDDANVYWTERGLAAVFSCPLTGCARPTRKNVGGPVPVELAVDETRLYWTQGPVNFSNPAAIALVSKDDSVLTDVLVSGLRRAMGLTVDSGYLYWSNSDISGDVMRCPVSGCVGGTPQVLAARQDSPLLVTRFDDHLFWVNGLSISHTTHNLGRAIEIHSCTLERCASTNQIIAVSTGGGFGFRVNALPFTTNPPALPPREMVVDSDFVYWLGDVSYVESDPENFATDTSIRRAEWAKL